MTWFVCKVNSAGPGSGGSETTSPVIYINLTDQGGTFSGLWFYAAQDAKSEMLAVALNAISLQATVQVNAPPPHPNNSPYTEITSLYLNAS